MLSNIDSALRVLDKAAPDTNKLQLYTDLGESYYYINTDSALLFWQDGLKLANELIDNGKLKGVQVRKAGILNNLGAVSLKMGKMELSIDYFIESLKLKEVLGDKRGIGTTSNNIAYLLSTQSNYPEAIKYHKKAIKVRQEIEDSAGLGQSYNNMGYLYYSMDELDSALLAYEKSLELRKALKDERGIATVENNIGLVYADKGSLEEAYQYYKRALPYFRQAEDPHSLVTILGNIAGIESKLYDKKTALILAQEAYELANKIKSPEAIMNAAKALSEVQRSIGNYKEAFELFKVEIKMRDSIENASLEKEILRKEKDFELLQEKAADSIERSKQKELNDLKLAKINSENERLDAEHRRDQLKKYFLYGAIALIAAFALFWFNRFKLIQKQKTIIDEQKKNVEEQKNIIESQHQSISESISYAHLIQKASMPELRVESLFSDAGLMYKPRDVVSGDFYWLERDDNKVYFAVADCTGHGIPGAFISLIGTILLNEIYNSKNIRKPDAILNELNHLIQLTLSKPGIELRDGMDISFCSYDYDSKKLQFAGANNPIYIIRKGSAEVESIKADRQPIGRYSKQEDFTLHELQLAEGDTVYLMSDGFQDQFGGKDGKKFKISRLKKLLSEIVELPMDEQMQQLNAAFEDWCGDQEQLDDVCLIGARI